MSQAGPEFDVIYSRRNLTSSGIRSGGGSSTVASPPVVAGKLGQNKSRVYSCLTPGVPGIGSMTMTLIRIRQLLNMNNMHNMQNLWAPHSRNLKKTSREFSQTDLLVA